MKISLHTNLIIPRDQPLSLPILEQYLSSNQVVLMLYHSRILVVIHILTNTDRAMEVTVTEVTVMVITDMDTVMDIIMTTITILTNQVYLALLRRL